MKHKLFGSVLLLLVLIASFAGAETTSVQRKLAMFLVFQGNLTTDEKTILSETLLAKASEVESITVIEPVWTGAKDITYAEKNEKSIALGADCYLAVTITGKTDEVELKYLSYDISQKKIAVAETTQVRDRGLRSLDRSFWMDIITGLSANYERISGDLVIKEITKHTGEEKVIEEAKGVKVVILAQPRTVVEGMGKNPSVVDDDGLVTMEIPGSASYELYATCPGFYPVRKLVYIGSDPIRIELEQNPGSMFAVDLYLHQSDYLGAGFRYYYVINKFFVDFKTTLYMWKLIWPVEGNKNKYEAPLVHFNLLTGLYINNEDALFRFSVSAGPFIRVIYIDPLGLMLDQISGVGITLPSVNIEVSSFEKIRFFFEYNVNFYFTDHVDFFKTSSGNVGNNKGNSFGYIFTDYHFVMDLMDFKVGIRYQF
jgi:hypothetical protein